jgi:hypothetical protein
VSGASTIRGSSPPLSRAPSIPEPQPMDVFNDVDPESPRERECSLEEVRLISLFLLRVRR